MPSISKRTGLAGWLDAVKLKIAEKQSEPVNKKQLYPPADQSYSPNPFLRCPWPGISSPDSLRQFYKPGINKKRLLPVKPIS